MTLTQNTDAGLREVAIEFVGGQGDGVGEGLFVPLSLPGERLRVRTSGGRAEIVDILTPSPDRIEPPCPHFGDCGGCALQHWAHGPYLAWKVEQVRLALAREGLESEFLAPFAAPPGSRRRVSLHARREGGRVVLGFKARKTWRVVDVARCTIADPRIEAALPALARLAAPFLQHPKSAPTLHVTLTETGLDIEVGGVERRKGGGLTADGRMQAAQAAQALDAARVTLAGEMIYQSRQPVVRVGPAVVAQPAGGFLQASAQAEAAMADFVSESLSGAGKVADLFSGIGAFTFRLAKTATVHAVDSSAPAIAAMVRAIATAPGLKGITGEARDLARRPMLATELSRLDAVALDPPRAGAAEQCAEIAKSNLARAAYVSCNPQTFARDARTLVDAGFSLDRVFPVDQFLWSPHVELVGVFSR